eukprot:TRINITY_DN116_c0_g1_i6.p1 TRINITY_DN116_c0_g1~~TRINITY_DN116_c0_g1_i6.p1  ORF type:complete len:260 (-),score=54.46 TRINITY_DN116_c0_g1_i6:591-1370(-)
MITSFPLNFKSEIVHIPVAEVGKYGYFSELCRMKDEGKSEDEMQKTRSKEDMHTQPTQRLFVLFSGNPGIVECYVKFLQDLHERLAMATSESWSVAAIGLTGHDATGMNGWKLFSLQEQIDHRRELLGALVNHFGFGESENAPKLFVGGHSVGAYILSRIMADPQIFSISAIQRFFFLYPTIEDIRLGASFEKVLSLPVIRHSTACVAGMIGWMFPLKWKSRLVPRDAPDCKEAMQNLWRYPSFATHAHTHAHYFISTI